MAGAQERLRGLLGEPISDEPDESEEPAWHAHVDMNRPENRGDLARLRGKDADVVPSRERGRSDIQSAMVQAGVGVDIDGNVTFNFPSTPEFFVLPIGLTQFDFVEGFVRFPDGRDPVHIGSLKSYKIDMLRSLIVESKKNITVQYDTATRAKIPVSRNSIYRSSRFTFRQLFIECTVTTGIRVLAGSSDEAVEKTALPDAGGFNPFGTGQINVISTGVPTSPTGSPALYSTTSSPNAIKALVGRRRITILNNGTASIEFGFSVSELDIVGPPPGLGGFPLAKGEVFEDDWGDDLDIYFMLTSAGTTDIRIFERF